MRTARVVSALVAGLATVLSLQACSGTACTDAGWEDSLEVDIGRDLAARTSSLTVHLCQDGSCARTVVDLPDRDSGDNGTRSAYVPLTGLGDGGWRAGGAETTLQARNASGEVTREATIGFDLVERQPNGRGCDPTVIQGRLTIG